MYSQIALRSSRAVQGLVQHRKTDRSPQKQAVVTIYADLTVVKIPQPSPEHRPGGDRKPITEFSRASRRNMLQTLAKMQNVSQGHFLTLTYPGKFDSSPQQVKAHLAALRKRIARQFPDAGGIWRMELKTRKTGASEGQIVPHFHLLVFGANNEAVNIRKWVKTAWNAIVAPGDVKHLKAGTRTDPICSRRHAMSYLSKYAAKDEDDNDGCTLWGRRWGTFGNIDTSPILFVRCEAADLIEFRRSLRKLLKSRGSQYCKRLAKQSPHVGLSVLGAGGQSSNKWRNPLDCTAVKMLLS